jgi:hypothetical protein
MILPLLAVALLIAAVVMASQGRFGIALAIGIFAACAFQIDRARGRVRNRSELWVLRRNRSSR